MGNNYRRFLIPAALIFSVIGLLAGCIPIPVFKPEAGGVRPETRIGGPGSNKPLKLGRATREEVIRVLGPPEFAPAGGASLLYRYEVVESVTVYPLCFMASPDYPRSRYLWLDFGADGTLRRFKVSKDSEGNL
jgi:hypothetical protein